MASIDPSYSAQDVGENGAFTLSLNVDVNGEAENGVDSFTSPAYWADYRLTLEAFVTMLCTLVCVVGNSLILIVAARTTALDHFNHCYLYSLTLADLFLGLFVTSFSIFNSLYDKWVFQSTVFCCVEAYLMALFIMVSMISMAFLIVDHYVAVRKPDRYPVMMSFNRSLCWSLLTWVIATSFCCPPLFSLQRAYYYREAFLCVIDQRHQQTYFLTVLFMVTLPTMAAVVVTSRYLFTSAFRDQKKFYQRVYDYFSERSWNYYISFVMTAMFFITWMPYTVIRVVQSLRGWQRADIPAPIHFYCTWFGLSNCFTKFLVFLFMSPQFRLGLRAIFSLRGTRGYTVCRGTTASGAAAGASDRDLGSHLDRDLDSLDDHEIITVPPPRK